MTRRDENDLTDEELLEMWKEGEPAHLASPPVSPGSTDGSGRSKQRPGAPAAPPSKRSRPASS